MRLAEQWTEIRGRLAGDWETASLVFTVDDEREADRAAMILGPATPGRTGRAFRLAVDRHGRGLGANPELVRRTLARLDGEGVAGELELVGSETRQAVADAREGAPAPAGLAAQWDALRETVPPDWSHLYVEVALDSTDFVERAALLMAPTNPALFGGPKGLRFRAARTVGYGVAPEMARRCLERLDREGITGRLRVVRVVSDARPVATQGPVWYIGGKAV